MFREDVAARSAVTPIVDQLRQAEMRQILFLDVDGVLHRGIARRVGNRVISSAPDIELFEFVPVLEELLRPYPSVEIVLSSDWALVLGIEFTRDAMASEELGRRIIGATYEGETLDAGVWPVLPRGAQVLDYVRRNSPMRWLAVDDRSDGFEAFRGQLVHCQTDVGLGDDVVVEQFRQQLKMFFSFLSEDEIDE
ncbi:HAD domain-containing protein [Burkholderia sp. Ax-1719]|uniref:HAD domain-containing protein n=1 Tax=Burkholderia sp. Ax-1719 TaxID=2608334 RepID=UPI001F03E3A9|nr:HAD domain-containing protein [Burkholderia sp. Ax-1719]